MPRKEPAPIHQWTHNDSEVLFVRCLDHDGSSHGGFRWLPDEAFERLLAGHAEKAGLLVEAADWDPAPVCGGGLHGWPWGIGVGIGRNPSPYGLVFSAPADSVVEIEWGKCKVPKARVVYVGPLGSCMAYTSAGRCAWIEANSSGSASATGWSGSASATGGRGSASATGGSGSASATGGRGSASATGGSGSASATGWSGSASATGERSVAVATACYDDNDCPTVEAGEGGIAAVTADACYWIAHPKAVLVQRYPDSAGRWLTKMFKGSSFADGERVHIVRGRVVE